MGKVIDISGVLAERASRRSEEATGSGQTADEGPPESTRRALGERPDGAIDIAAWRAKWRPVFSHDFKVDMPDGSVTSDGLLRWFHDPRSNALELFVMNHEGASTRLVLPPTVSMQMLVALNGTYGFDPEGRGGGRLSDWEDGGSGPRVA